MSTQYGSFGAGPIALPARPCVRPGGSVDLRAMSGRPGYPEDRPPTAAERRAFWDDRYGSEGWVFGVEPNLFVKEFFEDRPPGRVLDLGCGQGRNAVWLALRGHEVLGVDLSSVAVEQARKLAGVAGVDVAFEAADLTTWDPAGRSFDYVVLSYLQMTDEHSRIVHRLAQTALAPGGLVFLVAHHLDNLEHGYGGPQLPGVLFTEQQLEDDFGGLEVIRSEPVARTVERDEGTATAIDVIFIGRKPPMA